MFQKSIEIIFSEGTPSNLANNLSICRDSDKKLTYACFAHINQVNALHWDSDTDCSTSGSIFLHAKVIAKGSTIVQCKLCLPSSITSPYLVVAATTGAMVYSMVNEAVLAWFPYSVLLSTGASSERACQFTKGIACIDDFILTGTSNGHIVVFDCSKPDTVTFKKVIAEHTTAIVDIAASQQEKLCCSCDVSGNIIVWGKSLRSIQQKICTKLHFCCMNVYEKKVVVGTFSGRILFFCVFTGRLLIDINAHIRQINAIVISQNGLQMLSISEDSFVRVWKLDNEKGDTTKASDIGVIDLVECVHNERLENKSLVGAQFLNEIGTAFAVSAYDYSKLFFYEVPKMLSTEA